MRDETPDRWRSEYIGTFDPDPHTNQAIALWRFYYGQCEAYDRTVCTGPVGRDGGILPASPREQALINAHAQRQHENTMRAAGAAGIPNETMRRARDVALRLERKGR
jgi:hypothetical protein